MKSINVLLIALFALVFVACEKDPPITPPDNNTPYGLGLNDDDDISKIPMNVSIGFGSGNLPTAYDLSDKLPPIGDQGNYGTCVAWTLGYNLKTALSGMDNNLSPADLSDPSNQFSPKDLFLALPDAEKSPNCEGTNFTSPLKLLQDRGIASFKSVPYTDLGNCVNSLSDPAWEAEANKNKIKYYRRVDGTINEIKKNISSNIPVAVGIKTADNFMQWKSGDVLNSATTYNLVGIHARHAVLIVGYDDAKGANGAVRIVNSWGDIWGDNGFIWVDYNFLLNDFIMKDGSGSAALYVAQNQEGEEKAPDEKENPPKQGVDLATWVYGDESLYFSGGAYNERYISYDIFNIGTENLKSSSNVAFHYYLINPYNVQDYTLIFLDQLSADIERNTYNCPNANECYINVDINAGTSFAGNAGWSSVERNYFLPQVTGEYYVVLVADAEGKINEADEQNNLFFSAPYPVYIDGGFVERKSSNKGDLVVKTDEIYTPGDAESRLESKVRSTDKNQMHNAYTNEEIVRFLKNEIKNNRHKNHLMVSADRGVQKFIAK